MDLSPQYRPPIARSTASTPRPSPKCSRNTARLRYVEAWGDDVPTGKTTSFPQAVKLEPGETVVFSWVAWPSREVRDAGMKKAMEDPRVKDAGMPFDGKRMIYGGFQTILDS